MTKCSVNQIPVVFPVFDREYMNYWHVDLTAGAVFVAKGTDGILD